MSGNYIPKWKIWYTSVKYMSKRTHSVVFLDFQQMNNILDIPWVIGYLQNLKTQIVNIYTHTKTSIKFIELRLRRNKTKRKISIKHNDSNFIEIWLVIQSLEINIPQLKKYSPNLKTSKNQKDIYQI